VPIPVGSIADVTAVTARPVTREEINDAFRDEAAGGRYRGILGVADDPDAVPPDAVSGAASRLLAELTSRWFEPAPDWYLEKEQQTAERRTAIISNLERLVAERPGPDEVRSWWLGIIRLLNRDPRLEAQSMLGIHLDLSVTPSCPAPGSPLRETLQTAALHAVGQAPVVTASQFPSILHIADAPEVTALTLLSEPPSLEPERWAGLALVLAFTEIDSADIIGDPRASVLDAAMTRVVDGTLVKVMSWYDKICGAGSSRPWCRRRPALHRRTR
jgi:hypothetical protein